MRLWLLSAAILALATSTAAVKADADVCQVAYFKDGVLQPPGVIIDCASVQ